jgi:hypothetical protein
MPIGKKHQARNISDPPDRKHGWRVCSENDQLFPPLGWLPSIGLHFLEEESLHLGMHGNLGLIHKQSSDIIIVDRREKWDQLDQSPCFCVGVVGFTPLL